MSPVVTFEERLPRTFRLASAGLGRLHPGLQIHVSVGGETVVDDAIGCARDGEPLTPGHPMIWLSAGKPLTAAAVLQQVERGVLDFDQPIARTLPEFGAQGKTPITVRQLLTHTSGLQPVPTGWPRTSWEEILERICQAKLRHGIRPGEMAAYDPQRTWFILGELLQRAGSRSFETILQEDVFGPLEMANCGFTTRAILPATPVPLHQCDGATCHLQAQSGDGDASPSPGSSFVGRARDLGRFYEALLMTGERSGRRFLAAELVRQMTSRQRQEMFDVTFQHVVDFGLGVIIDSNRYGAETVPYGFGRHCSPETFGHGGSECSMAFADPRHGLVVAWAANGRPGEVLHQQRNRELCSAVYLDLGLT